ARHLGYHSVEEWDRIKAVTTWREATRLSVIVPGSMLDFGAHRLYVEAVTRAGEQRDVYEYEVLDLPPNEQARLRSNPKTNGWQLRHSVGVDEGAGQEHDFLDDALAALAVNREQEAQGWPETLQSKAHNPSQTKA